MTAVAPTATPLARWRRPADWPWWAKVLAVYLATRALAALVFVVVARTQAPNLWTPGSPSYADYTGFMWDASWYREIAEHGYPHELPVGPDGVAQQNALAFFPLFPALARALMVLTGLGWQVVAPTLALLLGTGAALAVHQVVGEAVDRSGRPRDGAPGTPGTPGALPLATVAVLGVWGAAPVLQVAYTESLALLLLAAALLCLLRRRYLAAIPVVLGLGLTRAVALPLALAVVAHGVARWRAHRRDDDAFGTGERLALAALTAATALSGFLWPFLVGRLTGVPDAYTRTQAAWRGRREVVPVLPWLDVARWWAPEWWVLLLLGVLVLGVLAVLAVRRFGPELHGWTAGYLAYLVLVVEPGTSVLRFLVLAFPVSAAAADWALRRRRAAPALAALLVLGVLTEVAWVACIWRFVPPSGWPP